MTPDRHPLTVQYTVTLPGGRLIHCADRPSADRLVAYLSGLPGMARTAGAGVKKPPVKRAAGKVKT